MTKRVNLTDFLTQAQIEQAAALYSAHKGFVGSAFINEVVEKIIAPNLLEINRKLGQDNDARYLAYATGYILSQVQGRPS